MEGHEFRALADLLADHDVHRLEASRGRRGVERAGIDLGRRVHVPA